MEGVIKVQRTNGAHTELKRKRAIREKQNPRNSDAVVELDLKYRVVRLNGLMIDKFKPSFQ